jgi:GNAT superfamily N-acetyltransferase
MITRINEFRKYQNVRKIILESVETTISEEDEDRFRIELEGIGSLILTVTTPEYEFLDDLGDERLEELGLDAQDFIGKIEHIVIDEDFRGMGYAKKLMEVAIKFAKEKNLFPLYLNASPMGFGGLNLKSLTAFYEKFGFEVILHQGNNNIMLMSKPQAINERAKSIDDLNETIIPAIQTCQERGKIDTL